MGNERRKDRGTTRGAGAVYEGPEVLASLLVSAGSRHGVEEVTECFARAQRAGEERSEVIPTLFPHEPHFASPAEAQRLYSNLFGLWDRIAAGLGAVDDAPELFTNPPLEQQLPPRGSLDGTQLTLDLVESVWKHLSVLPERESRRLHDRFEGAQPSVLAWMEQIHLQEPAVLPASELVFETWAMFDHAFGGRLDTVQWEDLVALEAEPPPLETSQPALASYAAEQLDDLTADDPDFAPELRAQVERMLASVAAALTQALQE